VQRLAAIAILCCAGCRFSVDALRNLDSGDPPDLSILAADLGSVDLAPMIDFASIDLGSIDQALDPCANPPTLGSGNLAAQCVIGNPPTIDGDLGDWPLGQFVAMTKTTAAQADGTWDTAVANDANSSARFFVKWDLTYLYVAVSVTDDVSHTPNSSPSLSDNDAVEIFVDGLHDRTMSYGADDWQLVYSGDTKTEAAQNVVVTWPAGTKEVWGGSSPSWTLEAAIPWTLLGGSPAALGRVVGFDLKLDDNDNGSKRDRDLVMYYTATAASATCSAPYCRTDAFGAVQLQGR
jgi:cellulose/xylan binding protein with CBM9 domain